MATVPDPVPRGPTDALRDRRIAWTRSLPTPAHLFDALPTSPAATVVVSEGRRQLADILDGRDDRLLVVVGPCSIHDPEAALEYANRLSRLAVELRDSLHIVMRVYFEKPRTTLGWKGLVNDPRLDGSCRVEEGLHLARRLLLDVVELGVPVGCEFLDPFLPQYFGDVVSWGAIGARTVESQVHRQLASGLSMPVGIKNSTEGSVQPAVDAVAAASAGHVFTGIDDAGRVAVFATTGNADAHLVLRGGKRAPNYDRTSVASALERLDQAALPRRLVVDASHDNSGKDHDRQFLVVQDLATRLSVGEEGIVGVLLESFLVSGRQELEVGVTGKLVYGQSVTDACMDWSTTEAALRDLARARNRRVRRRRIARPVSASPDRTLPRLSLSPDPVAGDPGGPRRC
jgi:3-deoxy-7-phosphoheptulonate synthase